jgi:small-conductance mechanosensitive channel
VITLDLAYVIVPNSQLAQASIQNFTKPDPWSRRSLFIVAPYEIPPQRVQSIMLEVVRGSSEFLIPLLHRLSRIIILNEALSIGSEFLQPSSGSGIELMAWPAIVFFMRSQEMVFVFLSQHIWSG